MKKINKKRHGIDFEGIPQQEEYEKAVGDYCVEECEYIGSQQTVFTDSEGTPRFNIKGDFVYSSSFAGGIIEFRRNEWVHLKHLSTYEIGSLKTLRIWFDTDYNGEQS